MKVTKLLTQAEIEAAKPREKSYKLFDGDGLYLEVMAAGGKSWCFKYRINGKEDRITCESYPDLKLKAARKSGKPRKSFCRWN